MYTYMYMYIYVWIILQQNLNSISQLPYRAEVSEVMWVWSSGDNDLLGHLRLVLCLNVEIELAKNEPLLDKDSYPVRACPPTTLPALMEVAVQDTLLVVVVTANLNTFPPLLTFTNAHCTT